MLALPAAVRLPRTVVVRRALLTGLFLIGFVALAVAFGGGTAHAADLSGTQSQGTLTDGTGDSAGAASAGSAGSTDASRSTGFTGAGTDAPSATDERSPFDGSGAEPVRRSGATADDGTGVAQRAGARISEGARASEERLGQVVRPLTEGLKPVTDPVTAPVDDVVDGVRHATGLPVRLPGDLAGQDRNGGERAHHGDAQDSRQHVAAPQRCGTDRTADRSAAAVRTAGDQDRTVVRASADRAGDTGGRDGLPGQLPQGPAAPAPHTTGDGNGPRGGADHQAVLPGGRPHFGLQAGGVRAASGAPTRERSTDILEFPG